MPGFSVLRSGTVPQARLRVTVAETACAAPVATQFSVLRAARAAGTQSGPAEGRCCTSVPYLAQAAEHQQLQWLDGGVVRIMLDGEKTDGQLMIHRQATPGESASPVHVHDSEDEIVVLLQGGGIWWVGEQRRELREGGVAFLPRNVPHAYRLTSPAVDMLVVCTPSGMEDFVRAAGWDLSRPRPQGWEITQASMTAAGAATGQTILGPPLAAGQMIPDAYLPASKRDSGSSAVPPGHRAATSTSRSPGLNWNKAS